MRIKTTTSSLPADLLGVFYYWSAGQDAFDLDLQRIINDKNNATGILSTMTQIE